MAPMRSLSSSKPRDRDGARREFNPRLRGRAWSDHRPGFSSFPSYSFCLCRCRRGTELNGGRTMAMRNTVIFASCQPGVQRAVLPNLTRLSEFCGFREKSAPSLSLRRRNQRTYERLAIFMLRNAPEAHDAVENRLVTSIDSGPCSGHDNQ